MSKVVLLTKLFYSSEIALLVNNLCFGYIIYGLLERLCTATDDGDYFLKMLSIFKDIFFSVFCP